MSYVKRTPCQKYYDKTNKDGLHKSLSATRFVPFRRSSETTSDSGSDDFKIEPAEELSSSFSRSSSESCHSYGATSRSYHCILKDLNEINNLEQQRTELHPDLESLQDFRTRLNLRRKVKTRQVFPDDDRTDNSCDSTTTKAHEDILRSANLLKQEHSLQERKDDFVSKKAQYHKEVQSSVSSASFSKRFANVDIDRRGHSQEETLLMDEFDKILQIGEDEQDEDERKLPYQQGPSTSIARSSTENNFLNKSNLAKAHKSAASSPRFRTKSHSQSVLKAATSIPSLIFSNKSLKLQKSSNNNNGTYGQSADSSKLLANKKNSMDDDFFSISSNSSKTRRSPLRFLGNLVDDKLFRGRWSSTKRAKSTDEITWALANEDLVSSDVQLLKESGRTRKKSLGLMSTNSTSSNNTEDAQDKKRYKNMGDLICRKLFDEGYGGKKESPMAQKMIDLKNRKSSNTSSDILSISGSSVASFNEHSPFDRVNAYSSPSRHGTTQESPQGEIRAETLAEIEAFEELLKNHLQS